MRRRREYGERRDGDRLDVGEVADEGAVFGAPTLTGKME